MTKRMTAAEKAMRRFEKELTEIHATMSLVESGAVDRQFANDETKAAFLSDLNAEAVNLIRAAIEANPGLFVQLPDGGYRLLQDDERVVLSLSRPSRVH